MTDAPRKNLLYFLLVFVVVIIGIASGFFLYQKNLHNTPSYVGADGQTASDHKAPDIKQSELAINNHFYTASPASTGNFRLFIDSQFDTIKDNIGVITLKDSIATHVKIGDFVRLFDKGGKKLGFIGEVSSVGKGMMEQNTDKTIVAVSFLTQSPDDLAKINSAKIISYNEQADVPRLPFSAIARKPSEAAYVWELVTSNGPISIKKSLANIILESDEYVVITPEFGGSNIYLLNPDDRLKDGATIKIKDTLYAPAEHTEEKYIAEKFYADVKDKAKKDVEDYVYTTPGGHTQGPQPDNNPGNTGLTQGGCAPSTGGLECEKEKPPMQGVMQLPLP